MAFNSLQYLFFLPLVVFAYYSLPHRFRWALLLAASCYYYMCWKVEYIFLMLISITTDYFCSRAIEQSKSILKRRALLITSIVINLGILFLFKYFNFFNEAIYVVSQKLNIVYRTPSLKLLLPIGISFYTFQTMSYTIDVFLNKNKAERHFGYYFLYVSFFPQLVSGPIERIGHLLPQLKKEHFFDSQMFTSGLRLILLGFFKKLVVADRLAEYVDYVYASPENFSSSILVFATLFFAFQIYCDFSGYIDIASGSARLMGINLMQNFRAPYFSKSIAEFWHRWNISLSTWFRDYLYFPLGGNRVSLFRWIFNILAVFTISGLWHGAAFTFIIWGFLHGLFYLLPRFLEAKISKVFFGIPVFIRNFCSWALTFVSVCLLWVFFRANNLTDALFIIKRVFQPFYNVSNLSLFGLPKFIQNLLFVGTIMSLDSFKIRQIIITSLARINIVARWTFYYAIIFIILFFGVFNQTQFIYFQF